jgi:hypothetical protein
MVVGVIPRSLAVRTGAAAPATVVETDVTAGPTLARGAAPTPPGCVAPSLAASDGDGSATSPVTGPPDVGWRLSASTPLSSLLSRLTSSSVPPASCDPPPDNRSPKMKGIETPAATMAMTTPMRTA